MVVVVTMALLSVGVTALTGVIHHTDPSPPHPVPFVMFVCANRWLALRLDLLSAGITAVTGVIIVLTHHHLTPAMAGLALSSSLQVWWWW